MRKKFDPSHVDRIAAKMQSEDESQTKTYATKAFLSVRQTDIARKSRLNALSALIAEIVNGDPEISEKGLWRELRNRVGQGVIARMTADDKIVWKASGGKLRTTPVSALKDRLSRAKEKLKV